ncbi:hypothetical protein BH09PAT3_BH09PAT3_6200 [soil metagenome]
MDFLDPKKLRRHTVLLYTGYILIGIAILISTIVLVYQANGFGVNSKGEVVQNGLVFVSSQPNPANIYLNGKLNDSQTNSRLSLPTGRYDVRLTRAGYRSWDRTINVQGGDVQNFDYPFLFPKDLVTKSQVDYNPTPGIATQSRDKRWLLVQQNPTATTFDLYDLKEDVPPSTPLVLPAGLATSATTTQTWEAIQWADDNQHVLIKHTYGTSSEYLLIDRNDVSKSLNLNKTLASNPTSLTLIDNKYDQYHLHDVTTGELRRATLSETTPVLVLQHVLSFKSYGSKTILYATSVNAPADKVVITMQVDDKTYPIRNVAANTNYLLDLASYRGTQYVVLAAASENIAYIYRDPIGQLGDAKVTMPVSMRALRINGTTHVSFSPGAQYILAENGSQFGVYDIFLKRAYVYTLKNPLDAPQKHAEWMDGNRLTYVSGGKLFEFDYDRHNQHTLMPASSAQGAFFSPNYRYTYSFAPTGATTAQFTQTTLVTAADL